MRAELVWYHKVIEAINSRTVRERILLLVTGVVVVLVVAYNSILGPIAQKIAAQNDEEIYVRTEHEGIRNELIALQKKFSQQASEGNLQYQQLQNILAQKIKIVDQYKHKFIPANTLPKLLQDIVQDFSGLTLLEMETFNVNGNEAALKRFGVQLKLRGEYTELIQYIKKIEQLPFPIAWEELDYRVLDFPHSEMVLIVHTFSE